MLRLSRQLHVNIFTIFLAKLGVIKNLRPSLLVVPNKDIAEMLQYPKAAILDDYLYILPVKQAEVKALQEKMIVTLNSWFEKKLPVLEEISMCRTIVRDRIVGFIKNRQELLAAYIKMKNLSSQHFIKMVFPFWSANQ